MRLVVEHQALAAAMAAAAKHVLHRTTIPILSTVLLRASDCEVEVTATDLNRLFKATVEARIEIEGLIAVNASLLAGFVRDSAALAGGTFGGGTSPCSGPTGPSGGRGRRSNSGRRRRGRAWKRVGGSSRAGSSRVIASRCRSRSP